MILRTHCFNGELSLSVSLCGSGRVLQGNVPVLPGHEYNLVEQLTGNQKARPSIARQCLNVELSLSQKQTDITAQFVTRIRTSENLHPRCSTLRKV